MTTDRKRIQSLLDELKEEHTVQTTWTNESTPEESHDCLSQEDTSTSGSSVIDSIFDDETESSSESDRVDEILEEAEKHDGPWVNEEKFPGVTVVND
jgi:hypothetical protein